MSESLKIQLAEKKSEIKEYKPKLQMLWRSL